MKGILTVEIWVRLKGERHLAQYKVECTLEEAKWMINHEVFVGGVWKSANQVIHV